MLQVDRPDMIETIARAGIVNNVDGLFIETHFDPANAKSDGANMLHLDNLEKLLTNLVAIRKVVNTLIIKPQNIYHDNLNLY